MNNYVIITIIIAIFIACMLFYPFDNYPDINSLNKTFIR